MKRKPKNHKTITATTAESPLDPGNKSILQSTLDDCFSREPWRSKTDPYNKFCQRYGGLVLEQAEAESEFVERRRKCRRNLNSLSTEALSGRINGLRELVYLATEATRQITALAEAHPTYVANVAANYNAWPLLWTGGSFSKRQTDMLEKIRLGGAKPGGVNRRSLGQDPPVTRQWAILLLNAITSLRQLRGVVQRGGESVWAYRGIEMTLEVPKGDEPTVNERTKQTTGAVFSVGDIANLKSLAQKLKQPADEISRYLRRLISPTTKEAIRRCDGGTSDLRSLNRALVADLNRIVHGKAIYNKQRFNGVVLRPHVKKLVGEKFAGSDLAWLNRMLIEDAYPREIWQGTPTAPKCIRIATLDRDNPGLAEAARRLPVFQQRTAEGWWKVAERLLRIITRFGVEAFPGLSQFANTERVKSLKTPAGTQFSEVVKNVKPVFLRLSTGDGSPDGAAKS